MPEEPLSRGSAGARFFALENHGQFTVLKFGSRASEHVTDLGKTERLWEALTVGCGVPDQVLLISSASDSFSPASMDAFWDQVYREQGKTELLLPEALAGLGLSRQENAFRQFIEIVRATDRLVIMALQGECDFSFLGAALACDYRIAAEDTLFVNRLFQSEATAGVLTWFLSRYLGHAEAADILLEGRSLTASEAYELKLVNKIAQAGEFERLSLDTARRFAAIPAPTLRAIKRSLVASAESLGTYVDQIGAGFCRVKGPPATGTW